MKSIQISMNNYIANPYKNPIYIYIQGNCYSDLKHSLEYSFYLILERNLIVLPCFIYIDNMGPLAKIINTVQSV